MNRIINAKNRHFASQWCIPFRLTAALLDDLLTYLRGNMFLHQYGDPSHKKRVFFQPWKKASFHIFRDGACIYWVHCIVCFPENHWYISLKSKWSMIFSTRLYFLFVHVHYIIIGMGSFERTFSFLYIYKNPVSVH